MADESPKPEDLSSEQPQGAGQAAANPTPLDPTTAPEPIKETQAKTVRELRAESVPLEKQPEGARELLAAESPEATATREAAEGALNKPIEAVEDRINTLDALATPFTPEDVEPHVVGDTTTIMGRTIPFNIYDVVFISLAIFTVIEVITGTLLPHMWLTIAVLVVIAFVKAFHVVWFYMHLSMDNRIFWITLLLPFFIGILGLAYLAVVPPTGY